MFIVLLIVTFLVAIAVSTTIVLVFDKPIRQLLNQIIPSDLTAAWTRYIKLAIYVVGISGGVRIWTLERYISKRNVGDELLQLTRERWIVEIYQTIIGTLQSIVWLLLIFFIFSLIGTVLIRIFHSRSLKTTKET